MASGYTADEKEAAIAANVAGSGADLAQAALVLNVAGAKSALDDAVTVFGAFVDGDVVVGSVAFDASEATVAIVHGLGVAPDWALMSSTDMTDTVLTWATDTTTLTITRAATTTAQTISYFLGNLV